MAEKTGYKERNLICEETTTRSETEGGGWCDEMGPAL